MNCGCLIAAVSAFSFAKHLAHWPTLDCGVIADGVPPFLPLRS
jgi:hypothetical protein